MNFNNGPWGFLIAVLIVIVVIFLIVKVLVPLLGA